MVGPKASIQYAGYIIFSLLDIVNIVDHVSCYVGMLLNNPQCLHVVNPPYQCHGNYVDIGDGGCRTIVYR